MWGSLLVIFLSIHLSRAFQDFFPSSSISAHSRRSGSYSFTTTMNESLLYATMIGGGGGGPHNSVSTGGNGGTTSCFIKTRAGDNFRAHIGTGGGRGMLSAFGYPSRGVPGGGQGANGCGSGGGYSMLSWVSGTSGQEHPIIIAGGGGGAGMVSGQRGGHGGGSSGESGSGTLGSVGVGGTQTTGGAHGLLLINGNSETKASYSGAYLQGGNGSHSMPGGGGGYDLYS